MKWKKLKVDRISPQSAGDSFLGPTNIEGQTEASVKRIFGSDFFDQLKNLQLGAWSYPVESAYGWHLVYVHEKTGSKTLSYDAARNQVLKDWRQAKRLEARSELLKKLKKKYTIEIDSRQPDIVLTAGKRP